MTTPEKIRSFRHLPDGWHYGSGSGAASEIVELALAAEQMLRACGYPETDAFPGVGGEIAVTGYRDGRCINIEISDETPSPGATK